MSKVSICPRCNFEDTGNFCSKCGYKFKKKRLNSLTLVESTIDFFYNLESRYFTTFKDLSTKPITFIESYLTGNRRLYYAPIKYMLFNAGINLFVVNFFKLDKIRDDATFTSETYGVTLQSEQIFNSFIDNYGQFLNVAVIPLFVLASLLVNRKSEYNASERAAAIMYLYGHLLILETVLNLLGGLFPQLYELRSAFIRFLLISAVIMLNYKFFKENILNTVLKSVFTLFVILGGMFTLIFCINFIIDKLNPV